MFFFSKNVFFCVFKWWIFENVRNLIDGSCNGNSSSGRDFEIALSDKLNGFEWTFFRRRSAFAYLFIEPELDDNKAYQLFSPCVAIVLIAFAIDVHQRDGCRCFHSERTPDITFEPEDTVSSMTIGIVRFFIMHDNCCANGTPATSNNFCSSTIICWWQIGLLLDAILALIGNSN